MKLRQRINTIIRSVLPTPSVPPVSASTKGADTVWPWDSTQVCTNPMKVATVYRCVKAISEGVAMLPLRLERKTAEGIYAPESGRLAYLLEVAPNPYQNAFDFKRQLVQQLLCTGNAYVLPRMFERGGFTMKEGASIVRSFDSLWLLSPGACHLDPVNMVYHVHDTVNGIHGTFLPEEIIHVRNLSRDGKTGVGVLEHASVTCGIAAAGDAETKDRFTNGGNVRGFFTNAPATAQGHNPHTDKYLQKIASQTDSHFRLGGRISVLPGSVQFKELMLSSADMQFLESRKFTTREICFFFSVHPSYIGATESSNYKDAENATLGFLQSALNPILVQIETELRHKLLTETEAGGMRFTFDRTELMACDLMTRASWQEKQLQTGQSTLNELRKAANRPAVEGGDIPLVSANLKPLASLLDEGKDNSDDNNDNTDNNDNHD